MYQGYNLVKAALADHIAIIFPIFGVVFLALGLAIGGTALLALYRINKEGLESGETLQMQGETENQEMIEEQKGGVIPEVTEEQKDGENPAEPKNR